MAYQPLPLHKEEQERAVRFAGRHRGPLTAALALAAMFLTLLVDALVHPVAIFDVWLIRLIQRSDHPAIWPVFDMVKALTGSEGAVIAWVVVGLVFLLCRWWAPAVALGLIPIGGVINEGVSLFLVERSRPHMDGLFRTSWNYEERSFPSGHVTGAVLLYGLIFVVSRRIENATLRSLVQVMCVAVLAVTGYQRVWGGAHWPSDVLAAYALGGLLLIGLVALGDALEPELAGRSLPGAASRAVSLSVTVASQAGRFVAHRPAMSSAGQIEPSGLLDGPSRLVAYEPLTDPVTAPIMVIQTPVGDLAPLLPTDLTQL